MPFNFSRAKLFLYSNLVFIGGIALASFLPNRFLRYDLWFFGAAAGCAVIIILHYIFMKATRRRVAFVLFFIFFLLGVWRYSVSLPVTGPDKIWFYNGQKIEFIGTVNREPDMREDKVKLTVGALCLEGDISKCRLPVRGNVLITVPLYPNYNFGDTLKIKCELQAPEQIDDFYYDRYLAMQDIYSTCYNPKIDIVETGHIRSLSHKFYAAILKLKAKFADAMSVGLSEPENSLLQGMILNNRGELPQELKNSFAQAGITHIIAISGMNISIISVIIINFLIAFGLSRRWALISSAAALTLYLILIGLPASAVRAGVMAFVAMLAVFFGRLNKLTNALVFAAVLMLLLNPKSLRDDIGFQLSFLALLSIIYVYPIFKEWVDKIINVGTRYGAQLLQGIIDIIVLTLAAQVLTLPVIALNFHQVSLIAPLVNVLVLFLLPFIMVFGLIAPIFSILIPDLAWLWFAPIYFALKYMIFVADKAVKLPLAYLEIDYVWSGWAVIYYCLAILFIWRYNKNKKPDLKK
ncbi:MAG: ComEC/Rec2 family competence protein [Patescibacteria group bacterium]